MKKIWSKGIIYFMIVLMALSTVSPVQVLASSQSDDVLTVREAIENNEGIGTVEGYVIGHTVNTNVYNFEAPFSNDHNLILADDPDERDAANFLLVQITSPFRAEFGLQTNPDLIGEKIRVQGSLEAYFTKPGLKEPESIELADGHAEPETPGGPEEPTEPEVLSIEEVRGLGAGSEVTVQGVVTSTPGIWGGNGFYLQEETGGTYVFGSDDVSFGDEVRLTGTTDFYNGEFQIGNLTDVTVLGAGELPEAVTVTPAQVDDEVQGRLVKLENVTIENLQEVNDYGTFEFEAKQGDESVLVRVDNRSGLAFDDFTLENGDIADVTGVASVFRGTYQVKPRSADDITAVETGEEPGGGEDSEEDPVPPSTDEYLDLTILHTNDLHSRIDDLGKIAAYIFAERAKAENSLYLDAGDIFSGSPVNDINLGKPIIEILNAMELDAMAIGNHEFDYGQSDFAERVSESNFPWLSANMEVTGDIPIEQPKPYVIFEFEDFDVAVFSLLQNPPATAPSGIVGLEFHDYVETALKYQEELEAQADIIIALTHIGYQDDRALAEAVDYFDLIVGGHSHTALNQPQVVSGTPIVQAGSYASHVGKVHLSIDPETKEVVDVDGGLTPIVTLEETDEEVQTIIDRWNVQMDDILGIVVGESDTGLSRDERYEKDAPLGNFWTDAMAFAANADIAFTNNGGIRDSIAPGEITVGDIYRVEPFDNQVMLMEMTGQAIKDVIEYSYTRDGRNQIDLQSSGLNYTIITDTVGNYIDAVLEVEGEPIDLDKTYRVAVSDYLGTGGSGYNFVGDILYAEVTPMTTAMISYAEYLTELGEKINYVSEGRIAIEVDPNAAPVGEVIGTTANGLSSENKELHDVGIGNLYTDAVRAKTGANIAILNGTSVTGEIPSGDITKEQIEALDRFENKIVVVETTGAKLKDMLLSQSNYHGKVDIQASGIQYTLVEGEGPNRFDDIVVFLEDGTPVRDEEVYVVAYNDYMHHGGHYTLNDVTLVEDGGPVWEAVVEYILEQDEPIDFVEGERIRIVEGNSDVIVVGDRVVVSERFVDELDGSELVIALSNEAFTNVSEVFLTTSQVASLVENEITLVVEKKDFSVEIPSAVFTGEDEVRFTFEKTDETEFNQDELSLVSSVYDFGLVQGEDTVSDFGEEAVTIGLSVTEDVADEDNLAIYYFNEKENVWEPIGGDLIDGYMVAQTDHFSLFAVFEAVEEIDGEPGAEDPEEETPGDEPGTEDPGNGTSGDDPIEDDEDTTPGDGGEPGDRDEADSTPDEDDGNGESFTRDEDDDTEAPQGEQGREERTGSDGDQTDDGTETHDSDLGEKVSATGGTEGKELPKTATDMYQHMLIGLMLLLAGMMIYIMQCKGKTVK